MKNQKQHSIKVIRLKTKRPAIVYFSGTGGTETAAVELKKLLDKRGNPSRIYSLDRYKADGGELQTIALTAGFLFVLFPVHAADAPLPVYEWLQTMRAAEPEKSAASESDTRDNKDGEYSGAAAVIFSVSGGGSIWPNNDCRRRVIRQLELKGIPVIYERMLVMPTNWTIPTPALVSALLLKALPYKLKKSLADIENGKVRRKSFAFGSAMISWVAKLEHKGARRFGRNLYATEACNGCGWCARSCPRYNISMGDVTDKEHDPRPQFDNSCVLCMRCIYGCPQQAIEPGFLKFMKIEKGFSLPGREETSAVPPVTYPPKTEVTEILKTNVPGLMWKGVRKYLTEEDR